MLEELDNDDQLGHLQRTFALGSPILVIGPGCHRIGYEETAAWKSVTARMAAVYYTLEGGPQQRFLQQFWESKLSDETRRGLTGEHVRGHAIDDFSKRAAAIMRHEPARVKLAGMLLRALVECTRCLGTVISGGETPVSNWLAVSYGQARRPYSAAASSQFGEARNAVGQATAFALALEATLSKKGDADSHEEALLNAGLDKQLAPSVVEALKDISIKPIAPSVVEALKDMKIKPIARSLNLLRKSCFPTDERQRDPESTSKVNLSGALVEWLADLLWHVVISGAGVPPSQDELSFYLNLRTYSTVSERGFSRPQPGDLRSDEPGGRSLTSDVCGLLRRYDVTMDRRDWRRPRERFTATIGCTLAQVWADERGAIRAGSRKGGPSSPGRLVVALVSDYDLMLERALLDGAQPGDRFHVIVPVWTQSIADGARANLEWLFGTYVRGKGDVSEDDVRQPHSWTWLHEQDGTIDTGPIDEDTGDEKMDEDDSQDDYEDDVEHDENGRASPPIGGPIIIKLAGSPIHELGNSPERTKDERPLELATIFSEHDSMEAMVSLAQTTTRGLQDGNTLVRQLFGVSAARGLEWRARSWLFFGHRFSDWLPRLRLFLTANNLGLASSGKRDNGSVARQLSKIAIDRSFDWPERTLLAALAIDMYVGDLSHVSTYPEAATEAEHEHDVGVFLANVQRRIDRLAARLTP